MKIDRAMMIYPTGKVMRIRFVLLTLLLFGPDFSLAQFKKEKFLKPEIMFKFENSPPQQFIDTTGQYGSDELLMGFKMPIVSRLIKGSKAGSFGFWAVLFNAGGSCSWQKFTYLSARQQFINFHSGLSAIYYPGKKSVYLVSLNSGVSEDNYSISMPRLKFTGTLLMSHRVSDLFSYTLGVAYSYLYGNGLPLPVIGGRFNPGKKSSFNFIFPFNISYSYRFGKANRVSLFIRPAGGLYHISNRGQFNGYPEIISLRQRVFRLGAATRFALGPVFKIGPEMGVYSKRNISMSEIDGNLKNSFFKEQTRAGIYFGITLSCHFGRRAHDGTNDAVNYLLDNGIDNLPNIGDEKLNSD